jgi:hypothetical protein
VHGRLPALPVALVAILLAGAAPQPPRAPAPKRAATPAARAREAVSDFVVGDLAGKPERYERAEVSPERLAAAQPPEGSEELPETGLLFDSVAEPFVAVTASRIVDVQVDGPAGSATVEYERIAESAGLLDVRESPGTERVVLRLRHDGRRWWVVDPPPAHVEAGALVRLFEQELTMYGPAWDAQAGAHQRAVRDRTAEGLRVLRAAMARAKGPALQPAAKPER